MKRENKMRKKIRKRISLCFIVCTIMLMSISAFAQSETYTGSDSGSASIAIHDPLEGQTYAVYKLFDAVAAKDGSIVYTGEIPENLKRYFEYTEDAAEDIDLTGDALSMEQELNGALQEWAADETPLMTAAASGEESLKFKNLPYGYYVVLTEGQTGALAVTSEVPYAGMYRKNTSAIGNLTKKITKINDQELSSAESDASAMVGDTISYEVSFYAGQYVPGGSQITAYEITDRPTGLQIQKDSVTVKINDTEITSNRKTITWDDANGALTITLPWENYNNNVPVKISYQAVLTGTTGTNTATVTAKTSDDDYKESRDNTATVKTGAVELINTAAESSIGLSESQFKLYEDESGTKEIKLKKQSNGTYLVNAQGTDVLTTGADGKVTVKGLRVGTDYWMEQTQVNDEYILNATKTKFQIASAGTTESVAVTNEKKIIFPEAGSIGTGMFYTLGGGLVCTAGACLMLRRRKASGRNGKTDE